MVSSLTQTADTLISHYRVNRARYRLEESLGFRIREASRKNIALLRAALLEGTRFIDRNLTFAPPRERGKIEMLWDRLMPETLKGWVSIASGWWFGPASPQEPLREPLNEQEIALFDLIIDNLTIKHCLHNMDAVVKSDNQLRSIRERLRLGEVIEDLRTGGAARQEYLYFSCGIGNAHYSRYMTCGRGSHEIAAKLSRIWQQMPQALRGLYTSPHENDMVFSKEQRPVWFSDTKFYFKHHNASKTKTYFYERADGTRYCRTVNYQEEYFYEKDVMPAIAYQLLLHLRFIGGRYREHILSAECEEQLRYLEAFMDHAMPSWVTPEAKIPARFSIKLPGVEVATPQEIQEREFRLSIHETMDFKTLLRGSSEKILEWIKEREGKCNLRDCNGVPIVNLTVQHCRSETTAWHVVKNLRKNGAPLHSYCTDRVHALGEALQRNYLGLAKWLLSQRDQDSRDFEVEIGLSVNSRVDYQKSLLSIAVGNGVSKIASVYWLFQNGLELNDSNDLDLLQHIFLHIYKFPYEIEERLLLIEKLMEKGLPLYTKNQLGARPLMLAAMKQEFDHEGGRESLTGFLLGKGARVDEVYNWNTAHMYQGYTALHFAADSDSKGVARLLLEAGANPNAKALNGETPFSIARKKGHGGLEKLLLEYGAKEASDSHSIPLHAHCVACIVTGVDAKGNSIVVLGKKFSEIGGAGLALLFPGGYKDIGDANFVDAAMREMEEEGNIPLRKWVEEDGIIPACIHRSEQIASDNESLHLLEFIHFDVGARLQDRPLIAKDDLLNLSRRRLNEFDPETFSFGNVPVRYSNGVVLRHLAGKGDPDAFTIEIEEAIKFEREGGNFVTDAIKTKDHDRLRELLSSPMMRSSGRPVDICEMLLIAEKEGNLQAVHILQPHLSPHELTTNRLKSLFLVGCRAGNEPLLDLCRGDARFKLSIDLLNNGIGFACKGKQLPLVQELVAKGCDARFLREEMEEELNEELLEEIKAEIFDGILILSARINWVDGIDYAAQEGVELNWPSAAKHAARKGSIVAFKALLEHKRHDREMYRAMLQKGLYGAVQSCKKETVQVLLDLGANPFHYDSYQDYEPFQPSPKKMSGWTMNRIKGSLLEYAASWQSHWNTELEGEKEIAAVLELLLSQSSPDERSQKHLEESAALAIACHHGNTQLWEVLLKDERVGLEAAFKGKTALIHLLERRSHSHDNQLASHKIARLILIRALKKEEGRTGDEEIDVWVGVDTLMYSCDGEQSELSLEKAKELIPNQEYAETVYNTLTRQILM